MNKQFYIYMLTNKSGTLYIGVTNNLIRRVWEHKEATKEKNQNITWWSFKNQSQNKMMNFTSRYKIHKLIYYEILEDPETAIRREKQLKSWRRSKKMELIKSVNPQYEDLYFRLL